MMTKLVGKCHCGKNKFTLTADPEFQFICYCHDCRVINSGGHLCGMLFDENQLAKAENTQTYTYKGGSGMPIEMHFCQTCGTHLYAFPEKYKGKVVVRANTLIGTDFKPEQFIFTESAFEWDKLNLTKKL